MEFQFLCPALLLARGEDGQHDLSDAVVFSASFSLKYSVCQGALFWGSISCTASTLTKWRVRSLSSLLLPCITLRTSPHFFSISPTVHLLPLRMSSQNGADREPDVAVASDTFFALRTKEGSVNVYVSGFQRKLITSLKARIFFPRGSHLCVLGHLASSFLCLSPSLPCLVLSSPCFLSYCLTQLSSFLLIFYLHTVIPLLFSSVDCMFSHFFLLFCYLTAPVALLSLHAFLVWPSLISFILWGASMVTVFRLLF